MNNDLLTIQASAAEIANIIAGSAPDSHGTWTLPIYAKKDSYEFKAELEISTKDAKAYFHNGAMVFGPIEVTLQIDLFEIFIDWHRALGIPHEITLKLEDPCGDVYFSETLSFDLPPSHITFCRNPPPITLLAPEPEILDLAFEPNDDDPDFYKLTGNVAVVDSIFQLIAGQVVSGTAKALEDFIDSLLQDVFGNNALSQLFIALVQAVFNVFNLANSWLQNVVAEILQPVDEWLAKVFSKQLHITVQSEAFPKKMKVVSETKTRPAVYVSVEKTPQIHLKDNKFTVEVLA